MLRQNPQEDFRLPARTDENINISNNKVNLAESMEKAFLQDVQNYPDSGIALRYKRLDLSVRQGQRLKAQVLRQLLIEQSIETTKTGRKISIHLTEKGKAILSA